MIKTNIEKWLNYNFKPVECRVGKDFTSFSRAFKREIELQVDEIGCEIVGFSKGYFYISGFIYNPRTDTYMYFSILDVRYGANGWYNKILVRIVMNAKGYCGGWNQYTTLNSFADKAKQILAIGNKEKLIV